MSSVTEKAIGFTVFFLLMVSVFLIIMFIFIIPSGDGNGGGDDNGGGGGDDPPPTFPSDGSFKVTSQDNYTPTKNEILRFGNGRSLSYDPIAFNLVSGGRIEVAVNAPGTIDFQIFLKTKKGNNDNRVGGTLKKAAGISGNYNTIVTTADSPKNSTSASASMKSYPVNANDKFAIFSDYGNSLGAGSFWSITYHPPANPPV